MPPGTIPGRRYSMPLSFQALAKSITRNIGYFPWCMVDFLESDMLLIFTRTIIKRTKSSYSTVLTMDMREILKQTPMTKQILWDIQRANSEPSLINPDANEIFG